MNDVLYRLSHATTLLVYTSYHFGLPTEPCDHAVSVKVTSVFYRLSHATVYINYDGYATYSMTFKPKAKVGLMPAAKIFCQKSREYAKIGIGSQYGLAKISFDFLQHQKQEKK